MATVAPSESTLVAVPTAIPSLRANFAWTLAGNVVYAGCQWGMLSALAKLGDATMVGQFTLGLAICAPVFMFTNLQLRAVQATDVRGECAFASYFTLRLLATAVGLAFIAALLPFAAERPAVRLVIFLVAVSKSAECMSDVTAGLLQREERLKRVAISLMIRGFASVLAFSLVFTWLRSVSVAVLAMAAVWLAVLLFYDLHNARALMAPRERLWGVDWHELRRLLLLGLPLGWVATFASLNANIPRYFLQHYLGLADQGIYASLAYLVVAISLVVFALTQSVTTRLSRLFVEGSLREFKSLLTKLSVLGVLVAAVGAPLSFFVGRPILTLIYRREYADHAGLLALLVAVAGINTVGSFLFCGLTAARVFRQQFPVYAASVLVVLIASALLVPHYGLIGGGVALMLSAVTIAGGGLLVVRQTLETRALSVKGDL